MKFNAHVETYDKYAVVQKKACDVLISRMLAKLDLKNINSVLDIGCGTAYLASLIQNNNSNCKIYLNDLSLNMLEFASNKLSKNCEILHGDFLNMSFEEVDLIVSNFSFQWIQNIDFALKKVTNLSKKAFITLPIEGTFSNLINFNSIKLYSLEEIENVLCKLGVKYYLELVNFNQEFINYFSFTKSLYKIGATSDSSRKINGDIFFNSKVIADYKVLFIEIIN